MYDPMLVEPMRQEAVRAGCSEAKTAEEMQSVLAQETGTTLVFVNSVCGCAAAGARPALTLALQNATKPDRSVTAFAGNDREAVAIARKHFEPYQPSSPQMGLIKDGKLVWMLQRHEIEGRSPEVIANDIKQAFGEHC